MTQTKIDGKFYPLTPSAYYPNNDKRIHLFGEKRGYLPDIESACLPFDVMVTGEEV